MTINLNAGSKLTKFIKQIGKTQKSNLKYYNVCIATVTKIRLEGPIVLRSRE